MRVIAFVCRCPACIAILILGVEANTAISYVYAVLKWSRQPAILDMLCRHCKEANMCRLIVNSLAAQVHKIVQLLAM